MVAERLREAQFRPLQTTPAEERRSQLRQVIRRRAEQHTVAHNHRSRRTKPHIRAVRAAGAQVQALHLAAQVAATAAEEVAEAARAAVIARVVRAQAEAALEVEDRGESRIQNSKLCFESISLRERKRSVRALRVSESRG